jgi:biotin carboxyl carrier protein
MNVLRYLKPLLALAVVGGLLAAGYLTRDWWLPWLRPGKQADSAAPDETAPADKVIVSDQAQKNLGLTSAQLKAQSVWKTIQVPGMVVDRPGRSDRAVVAPITSVVSKIHATPGDTVRAGDRLFDLRVTSEFVMNAQAELFRTAKEVQLQKKTIERLEASRDSVAGSQIVEARSLLAKLTGQMRSSRQLLQSAGLTTAQIDEAAEGEFVRSVTVVAPGPAGEKAMTAALVARASSASDRPPAFEVQELKVEPGQQVQAGQTLCLLANHHLLSVEGRAFRDESALVERSVRNRWPVQIDFREDAGSGWPELKQTFHVRHLSNTIDPVNRTFAFFVRLENQSSPHALALPARPEGPRPGARRRDRQRLRAAARRRDPRRRGVVRVHPERQHLRAQGGARRAARARAGGDRQRRGAGDVRQGKETWTIPAVAQTAAQLERMAKAGGGAVPKGYHVHADGSLHKNHD